MTRRNLSAVVRYLEQLTGATSANSASDPELLERYLRHRDEAAFELLLWRHGTLVFNVCRRILPREQDAEDAFQATFLAFVRKAGSISRRASVASWLYKVAFRVALAAKARARKTAAHEQSSDLTQAVASADSIWTELRPVLDEEVNRLPERLRRPFVLCYFDGKTNKEAAQQLGCPAGTIFSRLARGREMLRRRLERRGITLSVAALMTALWHHAAEAVPPALLTNNTVRSALFYGAGQNVGTASAPAATLAEGVLRTMFVSKIKWAALLVLIVSLFAVGGVAARHALNAAPEAEEVKDKPIVAVVRPVPEAVGKITVLPGRVRALAEQHVYPVVSGYLKRLAVDIGDVVRKGDVLAEIDAPMLEMEYRQAEAALKLEMYKMEAARTEVATALAEANAATDRVKACEARLKGDEAYLEFRRKQANRYAALLRDRAIDERLVGEQEDRVHAATEAVNADREGLLSTRSEVAVKKSKVDSAKVALEMAKTMMDIARLAVEKAASQRQSAVLRANLDGIVTSRNINTGDFVSANDRGRQPLLTVMRTDVLRVVVQFAESDVLVLRPGVAVHLRANALPEMKLPECKVSRTGFAIDEKTGTFPVEIDVPNPKNILRPGMFITATTQLDSNERGETVSVPATAVVKRNGRPNVYVVRDDKAHLTPIRVVESRGKIEIVSGVRESDRIVADPRGLEGEVVPVEVKK